MANPEGQAAMDEEQTRSVEERYTTMEATLHVITYAAYTVLMLRLSTFTKTALRQLCTCTHN